MRLVIALAAGLLWAGVAAAQPTTPESAPPADPTAQTTAPADGTAAPASTTTTQTAQVDANHEIVCRTIMATGSRLSGRGHGIRICKTREQWEIEADQALHEIRRAPTTSIMDHGGR